MIDVIKSKLAEIEQRENIKILHCVESGSRAWGFASPDSDYDVRFIYVRPLEYYLRLEKTRDVIEWQLDDTLDINGWDVQKALRLLHGSNPTLFEWSTSPIVYLTTEKWKTVADIMNGYFLTKSGLYHYLSTAKKNYREYLKGEKVKAKKYFYVLRPLLACRWILEFGTPPPMLFSVLKERYLRGDILCEVDKLLDIKINAPEKEIIDRIDVINDYVDCTMDEINSILESTPYDKPRPYAELNKVFFDLIKE